MKYAIVHIADIHYRKEEPEGASAVLNAFVEDLEKQKSKLENYKIYLALTGDIVFAGGDSDSYYEFSDIFGRKLDKIGINSNYRIIVPGNHDIDQRIVDENYSKYEQEIFDNLKTEQKFNNYISSKKYKDSKFENYLLFETDFAKYGMDYSIQGQGWCIDDNVGVYCLNTAISSFGGSKNSSDYGNLAVYTRGLVDWCSSTKTTTNILLMHHPVSYLTKWSKDEVRQILENSFTLGLCGHSHEQNVFRDKISNKSLLCAAPQLFTDKNDLLGYAIILIEEGLISKIIYRRYARGKFLTGVDFSGSDDGIIYVPNDYIRHKELLEHRLKSALAFFKGQPGNFVKPKLSKEREFNNEPSVLDEIIKDPRPTIIVAHPQFGLTCLSHFMVLEAYKMHQCWIYLDAKHIKARNVKSEIDKQIKEFGKTLQDIKCIVIDSWDSCIIDHRNILNCVSEDYKDIPIIIMANYSEIHFKSEFNFSKLNVDFDLLHLQALERNKVRELVSNYNKTINFGNEDIVVNKVVKDLEALNVHRTPLNCLTLLKVFERDFNEELINRTKLIKAVLFILFTDADSFTYSSSKPDVHDCEFILGKFCKLLIEQSRRMFSVIEFQSELKKFCDEQLITINIDTIINILESNNILLRYNDVFEFKHSYWIFYFAAAYMLHDADFANYILSNEKYINFPEIIEFYTGLDGRRNDAVTTLLGHLKELIDTVQNKIGIPEAFSPFEKFVWNPSVEKIDMIRKEISDEVNNSNLPTIIKDQHADQYYDSEAPYDQTIRNFLDEYSVIRLMQSIKASSRALRNSNYVETETKKEMIQQIMRGWAQISNVIFWLSPVLAHKGEASYDGFGLILFGDFSGTVDEKIKKIFMAIPHNVVTYLKDDLSSKKMGPLIYENLWNNQSDIQRHFLSLFLIRERPIGWHKELFNFINMLHRNSFILYDLCLSINAELKRGFVSDKESAELKKMISIVVAKHEYSRKETLDEVPKKLMINDKNKLPIDRILAAGKRKKKIRRK